MTSLASLLPSPRNAAGTQDSAFFGAQVKGAGAEREAASRALAKRFQPPPYKHRASFVPRRVEDFADGGAFPEIHVAQYPLDMGRKDKTSGKVVALKTDSDGRLQFDAIVKQGQRKDKKIFSTRADLDEKEFGEDELARPDSETEKEIAERTRKALEEKMNARAKAARPQVGTQQEEPQYIRYTPATQNAAHNSGAQQRIIRMMTAPTDPLEPPKFKHVKVPRGAGSPPVPVMHSPPRKPTAQEVQDWTIPPCVSNWKNPRGYTISLDKRLAADGRGTQEVTISNKFAKLSSALYVADQTAREELEQRNKIIIKMKEKERTKQEEELREKARLARQERSGVSGMNESLKSHPEADEDLREREELREMRRKQREREHRKESLRASGGLKKREEERDISERVALGQGPAAPSKELMYDQRLFNASQGLTSGFAADDSYAVYDKPLFSGSSANQLYRPKAVDTEVYGGGDQLMDSLTKTERFRPDKGFSGTEGGKSEPRNGPVQFEKEPEEEDPFGLDQFMTGSRKRTLDQIGKGGSLAASAGGGGGSSGRGGHYDDDDRASKRQRMEFEHGSDDRHGRSRRSRSRSGSGSRSPDRHRRRR